MCLRCMLSDAVKSDRLCTDDTGDSHSDCLQLLLSEVDQEDPTPLLHSSSGAHCHVEDDRHADTTTTSISIVSDDAPALLREHRHSAQCAVRSKSTDNMGLILRVLSSNRSIFRCLLWMAPNQCMRYKCKSCLPPMNPSLILAGLFSINGAVHVSVAMSVMDS
jgi:hypothetical protein